ncbi:conserved hypothetical protein [Verrucomicrobia bacterium]|nr:conserved hypothetical protein [Verrucomicrobiota bacterium]
MFITKAQLSSYGTGFSVANEYVAPLQARGTALNSLDADVTLFLSHSHKDKELIKPAVAFLRSHGVKVYVDWMDEGMPDTVSGETAKKLKDRIKQQKKFLVLVTENSKDSRWVPWELGYADPTKGMDHIAAFPVSQNSDFTHNEYLNIYPKVIVLDGAWKVYQADPPGIVDLPTWLRR